MTAWSDPRHAVLVDAGWLAQHAAEVVLVDVRWRLGDPAGAGRQRYAEGHLPGARFLDLETVLTRHTGDPRDGRHPLPDEATLAVGLAQIGVDGTREIVVYDEPGSFAAGRAWWVLRWAGLAVRVLDGGLDAWVSSGLTLVTDAVPNEPGALPRLSVGALSTVTADETARFPENGVLVDVRARERYLGLTEPLDPQAGHVPGAVNVPVSGLFAPDGTLPSDEVIRATFVRALGHPATGSPTNVLDGRPVAVYCGSGVSAAQAVLALAALGVGAALYPGSWSAWSNDPTRPVTRCPDVT
jgi:thiosulfate/3-mercaptopyruvate sulfurtransferase